MATTALQQIADGGTFTLSTAIHSLAANAQASIGKIDVGNPAPFSIVVDVPISNTGLTVSSAGNVEIKVGFSTGTAGTFPDTNNLIYVGTIVAGSAQQARGTIEIPVMDRGVEIWVLNKTQTGLASSYNGAAVAITWRSKTIAQV